MPPRVQLPRNKAIAPVVSLAAILAAFMLLFVMSRRPHGNPNQAAPATEAKAYLSHLTLSDVSMKASENFMNQQVVEIDGKLTNTGPRSLKSVEVYCVFSGVDGREIHRERVSVVPVRAAAVRPGETRAFRLPFDTLPEGWNQAMPKLVIASITFAS